MKSLWCKKQLHILSSDNLTKDNRCKQCRTISRQASDCRSGRKYRRYIHDLRIRIIEKNVKIFNLKMELQYAKKVSY